MNLLVANKTDWYDYVPGYFPDNVVSMSFPAASPTTFSLTFNRRYNPEWLLYNELSQIMPIPQYAWDKTSATQPVGNYDLTTSGAKQVFKYLDAQSTNVGTYATNPLWRAVDGPWYLDSYDSTTGYAAFKRNLRYSGPASGNVNTFIELPFTSDAAEYAAVLSGDVDYGYLPTTDLSTMRTIQSKGYSIDYWKPWGFNGIEINFSNPTTGPIFKQLYIRQAMELLIDQKGLVKNIFDGAAFPTYGPVPTIIKNPFVTSYERSNPYPYNFSKAIALLTSHGWQVRPEGIDVCARPGTAAGECGAGIHRGQQLNFTMTYLEGSAAFTALNEAMVSNWGRAGIHVALQSGTFEIYSESVTCDPTTGTGCTWDLTNAGAPGSTATYSPDYFPSGESLFATGSETNAGDYSNPTMNQYIEDTLTETGLAAFDKYENFAAQQLPILWEPDFYVQISAIKATLKNATPQNPNLNITPEMWVVS